MLQSIKRLSLTLAAIFGLTAASAAQILIVDDERVEREAAAYKDFNLQTNDLRNQIVQLRQYVARGGIFEQRLAALEQQKEELERKKAISGEDEYEKARIQLAQQAAQAQQALGILETQWDRLRQEAIVQVERARQPVIREILKERKAQVIMMKRLVMGSAPGMDVTTGFIERLDAALPAVKLTMPQEAEAAAEGTDTTGQ